MAKMVREPIQVYLSPAERAELEVAARQLGVSRSEALRRGIGALRARSYSAELRDLVDAGSVTPASSPPGPPPPSLPVASLGELLDELAEDRSDR